MRIIFLAISLWVVGMAGCGSDDSSGAILLACAATDECQETRRGSGQGSFDGSCTGEVAACPTTGLLASCEEASDGFSYDIIYYYGDADLTAAEMDCELEGSTWVPNEGDWARLSAHSP